MKTKITGIHIQFGSNEVGLVYRVLDDADNELSKQRAIEVLPDEVLAPVWQAAQVALGEAIAFVPADTKPGEMTNALMRIREARQLEAQAHQEVHEAEKRIREMEDATAKRIQEAELNLQAKLAKAEEEFTQTLQQRTAAHALELSKMSAVHAETLGKQVADVNTRLKQIEEKEQSLAQKEADLFERENAFDFSRLKEIPVEEVTKDHLPDEEDE